MLILLMNLCAILVQYSTNDMLSYDEYKCKYEDIHYVRNTVQYKLSANVSVEIIDSVIRNLKFGKACGPDDLAAEHLYYSYLALIMHLTYIFMHYNYT